MLLLIFNLTYSQMTASILSRRPDCPHVLPNYKLLDGFALIYVITYVCAVPPVCTNEANEPKSTDFKWVIMAVLKITRWYEYPKISWRYLGLVADTVIQQFSVFLDLIYTYSEYSGHSQNILNFLKVTHDVSRLISRKWCNVCSSPHSCTVFNILYPSIFAWIGSSVDRYFWTFSIVLTERCTDKQ